MACDQRWPRRFPECCSATLATHLLNSSRATLRPSWPPVPPTTNRGCPSCQQAACTANMSHTGTMRGTPKPNRAQAASGAQYNNSPSGIPRPALDTHVSHVAQSDAGVSNLSASRAKTSKRDEVSAVRTEGRKGQAHWMTGHPSKARNRPTEEEEPGRTSAPEQEGAPGYGARAQA